MAYQMVATAVTLNNLEGHSPVADVFACNPSNICAAFYTISTDSVLAWFLWISRASCQQLIQKTAIIFQLTQRVARFLCNSRASCSVQYTDLFVVRLFMFCYSYVSVFSTQGRYGPNGERYSYTLAMVFIQCIVNAIFARLGTYLCIIMLTKLCTVGLAFSCRGAVSARHVLTPMLRLS